MVDRSTHLQGMLWNHKLLPCVVKNFGKNLKELYCWDFQCKSSSIFCIMGINLLFVQPCSNSDCLYLHDYGSQDDSFTKDDLVSAFERYNLLSGFYLGSVPLLPLSPQILNYAVLGYLSFYSVLVCSLVIHLYLYHIVIWLIMILKE